MSAENGAVTWGRSRWGDRRWLRRHGRHGNLIMGRKDRPGAPTDEQVAQVRALMDADPEAEAFEAGVRQAIEWLRADYEYGTGPDWRENGAEWIEARLTDWRLVIRPDLRQSRG